ncbi:gliding motility-associated ABC transporter ATP-binding subunit GldA [Psychroflexus sp. S27]|uniref:gliding motility-associated ABC transporter ATP-binding subunit GldA n=1 Tax=Psychroflexus sp. S27 TaxID=1982757 RepID=UPI000C2A69C1|nr:gliding motility-associated ABC transporter ATP-binding subunit GldA [Psychroflexus sp. S27]PJX20074.1 gliding motility-associated ABC transporter ATP-binding subunit GldA [Psychroflexus sp. S27]
MDIQIQNLHKSYQNQHVLKGINFSVKTGEIVGLLGPNGAGKSTLMKILTGFATADEGEVHVIDKNINTDKLNIQKQLGYLPEQNPLYDEMYVREFLKFNADIFKINKKRIEEVIQLTQLTPEANKKIHQLSKGYKQRVGIAAALLHDPKILILDEPTTGLDPNQLVEIRALIKKISIDKTIILSTHIMQEVEAICNRVVIIKKGEIVKDQSLTDLQQSSNQQIIDVEFNTEIEISQLNNLEYLVEAQPQGENHYYLVFDTIEDQRSQVFDYASQHNLKILNMTRINQSLEDLFHELTS